MLGIKTTQEESGIDIWDDKWLPYIEGHPGVDISIQYSSEKPELYIGKVLASWNRYDDPDDWQTPMWSLMSTYQDDIFSIQSFINNYLEHLSNKHVSLLFFTTTN